MIELYSHIPTSTYEGSLPFEVTDPASQTTKLDKESNTGGEDHDYTRIQLVIIVLVAVLMWSNVFVVVANGKLTASPSRLYMSALAVSDLIICGSYIIYRLSLVGIFGDDLPEICYILLELSLVCPLLYSILLLQLIALDRYFAVCRPTSTFLRLERVKKLLFAAVFVAAALLAMEKLLAAFYREEVGEYFGSMVWIISTIVLVVVYTRIGVGLFQRAMAKKKIHAGSYSMSAANKNTEVGQRVPTSFTQETSLQISTTPASTSQPGVRSVHGNVTAIASLATNSRHPAVPVSKPKPEAKIGQMTKTGLMLTIVTMMFFVCWAPFWLHFAVGVSIPALLRDVYIANSLINPFIYWSLSRSFRERVLSSLTCGKFM